MSAAQYEPGTVAVATVRGVPNVRVFYVPPPGGAGPDPLVWLNADPATRVPWARASEVTDVRPLVVLDPDDAEQVTQFGYAVADRLTKFWAEDILDVADRKVMGEVVHDALRAQTRPPKPAEPTGLGAVVKDREGNRWVRASRVVTSHRNDWHLDGGTSTGEHRRHYDGIDAVEVLSEGVS